MRIGIIIARFQSPYLHEGHKALIRYVQERNDKVVVFLGASETKLTLNNPLDYSIREAMVESVFPDISVHVMRDHKYDSVWNEKLNSIIENLYPNDDIVLYGSRDSFIKQYRGKYRTEIFQEIPSVSATRIRHALHDHISDSQEWREGIIYASANKYPISYQAVDIAIINFDTKMILLGKKKDEPNYRFVGGFVDTTDESFEMAGKREVREECGDIETDSYKYIGSFRIDDWRYRGSKDSIMTAFFCCHYIYGRVNPQDDINELKWFDLSTLTAEHIEPEHHHLLSALNEYLHKIKS